MAISHNRFLVACQRLIKQGVHNEFPQNCSHFGSASGLVVGVGVSIPYAGLVLAILGLVLGYPTDDSDKVSVLLGALVLSSVYGALSNIPAVGGHITNILAGVSTLINAAALAVIIRSIGARLKA